ncbi:hypothetical protein CA238_05465, partial [Sphingomonas koreensis]
MGRGAALTRPERLSRGAASTIRLDMRVIFAFASLAVLAGCVAPSAPPPHLRCTLPNLPLRVPGLPS